MAANAATELAAFLNDHWIPGVVDQVGEVSTLLKLLLKSSGSTGNAGDKPGLSKMVTGGEYIKRSLRHDRTTARGSYSGYDVLNIDPNRKHDYAKFQWRTYAGALPQSLDEMMAARGAEEVNNWMKEHVNGLIGDVLDLVATGLYNSAASRTGMQSKGLNGLRELCNYDRTWGNIDSTSYSWWDAGFVDAVGAPGTAYTVVQLEDPSSLYYILKLIRAGADNCTHNGMRPTHFLTTRAVFNLIEDTMIQQKIYQGTKRADIGYQYIDHRGMEIVADDPDYIPDYSGFFLNLKEQPNGPALQLIGREGAWFKLSDWEGIPNQLARVRKLVAQCCLFSDQPRLFGYFSSLGAT